MVLTESFLQRISLESDHCLVGSSLQNNVHHGHLREFPPEQRHQAVVYVPASGRESASYVYLDRRDWRRITLQDPDLGQRAQVYRRWETKPSGSHVGVGAAWNQAARFGRFIILFVKLS